MLHKPVRAQIVRMSQAVLQFGGSEPFILRAPWSPRYTRPGTWVLQRGASREGLFARSRSWSRDVFGGLPV
eukprot:5612753-Pyramimonas_sp.AAC.1